MPINVGFSIEHHEAAAIEYAATRVVGPRQHMVLFDPVSDDISLELELEDANDLDVARAKAESLYKKIREVAGLPEAPPALTGAYRFGVVEDPASVFINEAEDMFEERRHELAVLAAQTACEVAARTAVERLVQGPSAQRAPLGSGYLNRWSLTDPASMMLFHAATGSRAWDEKWWSKYKAHVTRRNNVAHKGAGVTRDEARESLDIIWDFINYVRQAEGAMQAARSEPSARHHTAARARPAGRTARSLGRIVWGVREHGVLNVHRTRRRAGWSGSARSRPR